MRNEVRNGMGRFSYIVFPKCAILAGTAVRLEENANKGRD